MQEDLVLLLALLSAHLVGDFVFQSDAVASGKSDGKPGAFLIHGVWHFVFACAAVLLFLPERIGWFQPWASLTVLAGLHIGIDLAKEQVSTERLSERLSQRPVFLLDQGLHLLSIILVSLWLAGTACPPWIDAGWGWLQAGRGKIVWLLVVYLATIFGSGYFIRLLLPAEEYDSPSPLFNWASQPLTDDKSSQDKVEKGGMYIGWLERFVILTAVLAKSPTLIGLIITAKSIVRFKKLDSDRFAEYYLLGTFLSLALALAGGLFLLYLFDGTVFTALEP